MLVGLSNAITLSPDPVKMVLGYLLFGLVIYGFIKIYVINPRKKKKDREEFQKKEAEFAKLAKQKETTRIT